MVVFLFIAIALVMALGIVFVTGKGLGLLYSDQPATEEDIEEFAQKHINPIHLCRFIGVCILAGCVVAILFVVGLLTANKVFDIVAICLAIAGVLAASITYLVLFRLNPMKKKYYAEKESSEASKQL